VYHKISSSSVWRVTSKNLNGMANVAEMRGRGMHMKRPLGRLRKRSEYNMKVGAGEKSLMKEVERCNPGLCQIESFGIGSLSYQSVK
jgi:hypothetical protein